MSALMRKKDRAAQFVSQNLQLFQCPVCKGNFSHMINYQLVCSQNHSFDISKKATVYFLLKEANNQYDKDQLTSRFYTAQTGFWQPILKEAMKYVEKPSGFHLDVGCGEGSHLHCLSELGLDGKKIGFDISKSGINIASSNYENEFWCVADLANSPFNSKQFDTIFNIFSPSNYGEFNRLLKEDGVCIKVVPNTGYLKELRALLGHSLSEYSNDNVVDNFFHHFPKAKQIPINYSFTFSHDEIKDFFEMTPLTWKAKESTKASVLSRSILNITVDVTLLVGRK